MSDTQRDREERQHVIEVLEMLKKLEDSLGEISGNKNTDVSKALGYAISSLKTDLKYDLLYEETSGQADKQANEPIKGHCKNCKFFELNSWAACGGIPIIVAHEICKAWGEGCKTKEDGYCFLFEPQESEDNGNVD